MIRKQSKKKILSKILSKKPKVKSKKSLRLKKRSRKQKGGEKIEVEKSDLESTIKKVLNEESNLSTTKSTPKKGIIGRVLGSIPFIDGLVSRPEIIETKELQEEQDKIREEEMEKDLEASKTIVEKSREKLASDIKETIKDATEPVGRRSITGMAAESTRKNATSLIGKVVDRVIGVPNKVVETAKEVKNIATNRQCDAQFIANLESLLNTCGQEELINIYNEVAQKVLSKKQFYTPVLEKKMATIPILDYNNNNLDKEPELDIKSLNITQEDKNTIGEIQEAIERKLTVPGQNEINDMSSKKTKKKKKKKKKNKLTLTNLNNPNKNEIEV